MRRRALPKNVEVIVGGKPMMVNGGATIKALSSEFLYDLQQHWRVHRTKILDEVAAKYPAQYFAGMVTLSKVIRWEVGEPGAFDRPRTPEEIMDRLEERIGPQARSYSSVSCARSGNWKSSRSYNYEPKAMMKLGAGDLRLGRHLPAL